MHIDPSQFDPSQFDEIIDRRGTGCSKWDDMERRYSIAAENGLAMWVADMDFRPPHAVTQALRDLADHGIYGYSGDDSAYRAAIQWWMAERHGWDVDPSHIFSTHGLVNGAALCMDAYSEPGDGIVLFTPVYHAFFRMIKAAGREAVQCPMTLTDGRYTLDFDAFDAMMSGRERMLMLVSPHNPGGRVWTRAELEAIAAFARRHDLVIVSDEIHHDLVRPGHTHVPMTQIDGVEDRLVMMTAATKTFNIAGAHLGNVIIADPVLRARFAQRIAALGISAGLFGERMVEAAYSPEGARWVDGLTRYLDANAQLFDAAIAEIPGAQSIPLEGTYLAWVDFSGTGMSSDEIRHRICGTAQIAPNFGATFGEGGEGFMRFNLGTQRARVAEATDRLRDVFADLQ
ncbi:MAG: PatB family C-S lyase [Pseudomonadota bacterium]